MYSGDTLPRIRQTLFIVDKNRKYLFDVNQNITINKLKKMIIAAANLGKNGLRIFQNGIEYTTKDDSTLEELFPSPQLVEFTLSIVYNSEEDLESYIKVRFKQYCELHEFKYPYYYCYDCKKSICSLCVQSMDHSGHNFIEKYDYLQSSRFLVEQIFQDLKDALSGTRSISQENVDILKKKISLQFIPQLIDMLRKLETNLINLTEFFLEREKTNFSHLKDNVTLLKKHCVDGLDKLKSEIAIEDIMLDEEIFLIFDKKFKDIAQEKGKIKADMKFYEETQKQFSVIENHVNTIYNEISSMLEKYVNNSLFTDIQNKLQENTITLVSKDEIFFRLLSDVKKKQRPKLWKSLANQCTPTFASPAIKEDISAMRDVSTQLGVNAAITEESPAQSKTSVFNAPNVPTNLTKANFIFAGVNAATIEESPVHSKASVFNAPNVPNNLTKAILISAGNEGEGGSRKASDNLQTVIQKSNSFHSLNSKQEEGLAQQKASNTGSVNQVQVRGKLSFDKIDETQQIGIGQIFPNSSEIIIFNEADNSFLRKNVAFCPLHGVPYFLSNCAWINHLGSVYISGGVFENKESSVFLYYDISKDTLKRYCDMTNPRQSHSMFYHEEYIYAIGGNTNTTERFDLKEGKWIKMPNMNEDERLHPVLWIYKNFLYAFFGTKSDGSYLSSVERLNLKNLRSKWESVILNTKGINLHFYGCGIIESGEDEIFMFGGKSEEGLRSKALKFNFLSHTFAELPLTLDEGAYFQDSKLINIGNDSFGHFSLNKNDPFIKIQFA